MSFLSRMRNSLITNSDVDNHIIDGHTRGSVPVPRIPEVTVEYSREINQRFSYKLINNNDYHICVYWGTNRQTTLKYLQNLRPFTETSIRAYPSQRFIVIPTDEFSGEHPTSINMQTIDKFIVGDFSLEDFENREIHVIQEYTPKKSELDQWKEAALKSQFLFKELERLGANKNENLEPIMDMIQDIQLPNYTELDKEQAGIPSTLTNL